MGRKKIQISRILDQRNRQVTFTKRKFGLMKKAYELSVLCDCEIALIIFNSANRLFQYASTDMDKVLLKYTEYSEPHESRTNTDILETLKRKGLGLESQELELDEGPAEPAEKLRRLSDGVDLSLTRQRLYSAAPPLPSHNVAYGAVPPPRTDPAGLGTHGEPSPSQSHPPPFKPAGPKPGPPAGRSPGPLPPGLSYPLFSHGNLTRALASKTPPPLYLGADARRPDLTSSLGGARGTLSSTRTLYSSLQNSSPMVATGNNNLPGHGLGAFPFLSTSQTEYGPGEASPHPGFLQPNAMASWQPPRDNPTSLHSQLGSVAARIPPGDEGPPAPGVSPHPQPISIKSERVSPGATCPPTNPQHHLSSLSPGAELRPREDFTKGYPYPLVLARPLNEEPRTGLPTRRLQVAESWQR
ncbi:myocyte-specific enhancer factor 2B isoform X1 [Ornithorhynchus anatinus]|uniref:Myocyte enhancer factor 2B n=1 Tax=Ornithorhynchus anatinus TaxID=9258 RepID=F7FDC9_ORNAN|nr:myocyte-specific enhancer factor 2B isoform X1 [Ornithorhynchus anatinus]